jgi:protein SCO1/2
VSVDPRGDTPAAARRFLRRHGLGGGVHYLVGSERELRPVWTAWQVAGDGAGGPADHSLATWLVDARGRLRAVYAGEVPRSSDLVHDLGALTNDG